MMNCGMVRPLPACAAHPTSLGLTRRISIGHSDPQRGDEWAGPGAGRGGERFDVLLIDLATGQPEALQLDPQLMAYANLGTKDAGWIATHLKRTRGQDGREQLGPR